MIHLGGIKMAIANFGGFGDHLCGRSIIKLVRPKSEGRNLVTLPVPVNHMCTPLV